MDCHKIDQHFCWDLSWSVILLKFLFKVSSSTSLSISGTLVCKLPFPILDDADIRLFIDLKNLEENLIATEIDKNNNKDTTTK